MNKAADLLKKFEGFRAKPYIDKHPDGTDKGIAIGYGRNLTTTPLTKQEAEYLLLSVMDKKANELHNSIAFFHRLGYIRQMALVMMAYQMGTGGVLTFRKMLNALHLEKFDLAASEALDSKWGRNFPERARVIANLLRTGDWYGDTAP